MHRDLFDIARIAFNCFSSLRSMGQKLYNIYTHFRMWTKIRVKLPIAPIQQRTDQNPTKRGALPNFLFLIIAKNILPFWLCPCSRFAVKVLGEVEEIHAEVDEVLGEVDEVLGEVGEVRWTGYSVRQWKYLHPPFPGCQPSPPSPWSLVQSSDLVSTVPLCPPRQTHLPAHQLVTLHLDSVHVHDSQLRYSMIQICCSVRSPPPGCYHCPPHLPLLPAVSHW